jgi:CHAT domain-containing protein
VQTTGKNHINYATALNILATLYDKLGRYEEAEPYHLEALELRKKLLGSNSEKVASSATHGLTAGDFAEVGEPALVMTPPVTASDEDDGLLTASEVAHLRLNADGVVLSACNTAAPDGSPGAEGLSELARAFFYAGSRALLVSHWPVDSQAATRLTTRLFSISSAEPALGRAEALQRSMLELMDSIDRPYYAHPIFWAPFVVVGEGGAA